MCSPWFLWLCIGERGQSFMVQLGSYERAGDPEKRYIFRFTDRLNLNLKSAFS